jgi:hypothetical protein
MPLNRWLILIAAVGFTCSGAVARSGEKKDKVELLSPKEGAVVGQLEEMTGKLSDKEGWPVVFIRAKIDAEPFWIQPAVTEVNKERQFTVEGHFGTDDTPAGTAFTIVIGVAKDKAEADKFKVGDTLTKLPAGLPVSAPITVYRDKKPAKEGPSSVNFSGRTWGVRVGQQQGPGPNDWSASKDNIWLDEQGHLHMAVTKGPAGWQCAEIIADRSLGYGEYRWVVSGDLPALDRHVVLGLFTYESDTREIDFELSRWGNKNPAHPNAQWVVQPHTIKGNMIRFDTGAAKMLTVSFVWQKEAVHGRCWEGDDTAKKPISDWTYTGRQIPPPGKERARINLWLNRGKAPESGLRQEVVIRSFVFTPLQEKR